MQIDAQSWNNSLIVSLDTVALFTISNNVIQVFS